MMCNFKTVMVADGNAAATDDDHNASLAAFYLTFGDVMSTDMLIGCLRNNAQEGTGGGGTRVFDALCAVSNHGCMM